MRDCVCLCVRCLSTVALKSPLPACAPLYPLAVSLASGGGEWAHLELVYCGMSGVW